MEAMGELWFMDLGKDNYNLPGYMDRSENGGRWVYYRTRAEGQNTLVVNPDATGGQVYNAQCQITDYQSAYDGGYAIVDMKDANMDAVRAGITIYGLYPSDEVEKKLVPLKPAMELISFITYIKEVGPGIEVSYGGTFKTERTTRIGTVCIGYGDGYPRNMSGKGHVLVKGKKVPILGRVCMDQLMIDLTDVDDVEEWDAVILLGRDGDEEITMEELAEACGGFHYEIPCVIGKRVPRLFVYNNQAIGTMVCEDGSYEGI